MCLQGQQLVGCKEGAGHCSQSDEESNEDGVTSASERQGGNDGSRERSRAGLKTLSCLHGNKTALNHHLRCYLYDLCSWLYSVPSVSLTKHKVIIPEEPQCRAYV